MKKHYLAFVALAAAAVATSCSTDELAQLQEQNPSEPQTVTLTASVDGNNDVTRVGMTKSEDGKSAKFYWHEDDKIFVQTANDGTYGGAEFTTEAATGAESATFTGEVTGTVGQYAVYPYNENHKFECDESSKTKLTYNLPASYDKYTPKSKIFGTVVDCPANSTNMPMLGTITENTISFKPIGGLAVIRIDAMPAEEGTITVTADQQLSGDFEIEDLSADEAQIATPSTTTTTDNTVKFTFSGATEDKVGVFYLPLATGNYTNVKITVAYNSITQTICYGSLDVARKSVTAIPLYNVNGALSKSIDNNAYDIAAPNADGVMMYYKFNSDNTGLAVTYLYPNAENYSGEVTIPESVEYGGNTYQVTSIGDEAFSSCINLTSVTIPSKVTSIGMYAFNACSSLPSVTIPNSVASIGDGAFGWCSSLVSIEIPSKVTSIGMYAFNACRSLKSITIPDGVTSIGESTFYGCSSLESVTILGNVTSIGNNAFNMCRSLKSITIPNSVTSIGEGAFGWCSGLASITIPDGVTSIERNTFNGCSGLTSITIPDNVTSIEEWAFANCSSLTSVKIPNKVTSIEIGAFDGCSNLNSVEIGDGVTTIGNYAFSGCSSLTKLCVYAATPPTIYSSTFYDISNIALYVPNGSLAAYQTAEVWKNFTNITEN